MKYFIYCRKSQEAEDRQVLSLQSQQQEIDNLTKQDDEIEIVDTYTEAFSAKAPGRKLFDEMLDRIEKGEAEGIISWHPDRLARNSMDGGRVIYLLDQGKLKDMRFCTYTFENSSQGKFMLNIIFGYSKYYVDSLSENVKRGQRTKLSNGWLPNRAPLGYRNCKDTQTIIPHEPHFGVVRKMFELLMTGDMPVAKIHRVVANDWRYTTPQRKIIGGKAPSRSALFKTLSNPFYAGFIRWNCTLYPGSHKPMITKVEYKKVQTLLGLLPQTRPSKREFAFSGLFRCGACGLSITAEHKRKPSGLEYVYYHCTRVHRNPRCNQKSIEEKVLDVQIMRFLDSIHIPAKVIDWFAACVDQTLKSTDQSKKIVDPGIQHQKAIQGLETQLANLTDLRLREVMDDTEFDQRRETLQIDLAAAKETADKAKTQTSMFEPVQILLKLRNKAGYWYRHANSTQKRQLLRILCSNPTIIDKNAILKAAKPLIEISATIDNLRLRGEVSEVRTLQSSASDAGDWYLKLSEVVKGDGFEKYLKEVRAFSDEMDRK